MKEQKVFHYGGDLENEFGQFWEFDTDDPNTFGEVIFLGKFIDSKGQKWDIGFQDRKHRKTGILVYSNEAPCYLSPSFEDLADAKRQIQEDKEHIKRNGKHKDDYVKAYEEMINRAEAKGLIK